MGQPSVRHRQMDSACAGQLLLFSQQAMHSPKATVCCMSRHCLPIQMSRARGTKEVANDWPKPPPKISNGLPGLTAESWAQSVERSQYLVRVMEEAAAEGSGLQHRV